MTRYLRDFFIRNLHLALCLCIGVAGCCLSDVSRSMTRAELYQATVPNTDRSAPAQTAAFQAAMKIVLVRVTGRRSADADPALAPLVAGARRYVQQYSPAPDGQLWVSFDGAAIERWLTQNGEPLWGHERPTTIVWLTVQTGAQSGIVVTADDMSDLKMAIDEAAAQRGVPLLWPTAADVQKNHLNYSDITGASPATLAQAGKRLGAEGVLIGRAGDASANANVRWTQLFQDHSSDYSGTLEGVNRTADLYASLFAASGSLAPMDIEVSGVADLRDYASLETYLESLSSISHVNAVGMTGDTVRFRLVTRGGVESLQRTLSLNGRLLPHGAGDNGIQRFELRR